MARRALIYYRHTQQCMSGEMPHTAPCCGWIQPYACLVSQFTQFLGYSEGASNSYLLCSEYREMSLTYPLYKQVISSFVPQTSSSSFPKGVTHHTSLSDDPNEYIFQIDVSTDGKKLCMSLSDCSISVMDREILTVIGDRIRGHTDRINALCFSPMNSDIIISASSDHTCCCWDMRTPLEPVSSITLPGEISAMTLGVGGSLIATACGTSLYFHDMRQLDAGTLGQYADCHTDEITSVKFHPNAAVHHLLSGGEDGLICVYDTSVSANDEAVISILNTDCPTRQIGFFGTGHEGVYCLSSVETASIWHYPSAQRISNFPSIRESLGCDYLIDCWYQDDGSLNLLAGDHAGKGVVTNIQPGDVHTAVGEMLGGHSSTMRCACFLDDSILTAGEDSRLCVWGPRAVESQEIPKTIRGAHYNSTGGKASNSLQGDKKKSGTLRHSPY